MSTARTRTAVSILGASALALLLSGCLGSLLADEPDTETDTVVTETTEAAPVVDDNSGQTAALESYVAQGQASVPLVMEQYGDIYSDFQVLAVPPGTMEYSYTYLQQMDPASVTSQLDASVDQFQDLVETAIIPEMEANGITEAPTVRYTYYNADGTLIWTMDFSAS